MDKSTGKLLFSASDLVAFTGCRVRTTFELAVAHGLQQEVYSRFAIRGLQRSDVDPTAEILQRHGDKHEADHLIRLKAQKLNVVEVSKTGSSDVRVQATIKELAAGPDVIFQAALRRNNFIGYADFLIRSNPGAVDARPTYDIADTKLAKSNRAKFMLQLGLYADLLEDMQGSLPKQLIVVLGGSGAKAVGGAPETRVLRTDDYIHYTRAVKAKFLQFVQDPSRAIQSVDPVPVAACALCPWHGTCEAIWVGRDDLSLIANIRRSQILALGKIGIKTREALTKREGPVNGIGNPVLEKLRRQASLQLEAERQPQGLPPPEFLPAGDKPSGFALLPPPDPGDLYFDMEGYPYEPGGLEYLFGIGGRNGTNVAGKLSNEEMQREFQFAAFWAHNRAEEKLAFEQFMDFVTAHLKNHPNAHIYHYAAYENTAIKRLAGVHDTRTEQRDELLREGKLVDLYRVVAGGLLLGLPSYSIKKVEAYYRAGARKTAVTSGGESIVKYERYRLLDDEAERGQIIAELHDYNRDDVLSTLELHNWLEKIRPRVTPTSDADDSPDPPDAADEKQDNRSDQQKAAAAELAAEKEAARTALKGWRINGDQEVQRIADLLGHLLDFYWRCKLPTLWRRFQRQVTPEAELIDDPECLALLVRCAEREKEKSSFRYTYKAPPQETTLATKAKVRCLTDGGTASNFVYKEEDRIASFTRGVKSNPPPDVITLCGTQDISTDDKLRAICKFIQGVCEGMDTALGLLLKRAAPRLTGRMSGTAVVDKPDVDQVIAAVRAMDRSHLVIQGPPGTGKTTTAAAVIAALVKDGRRVGITSNSHAAIDNLLVRAVQRCGDAGITVSAAKVQSEETGQDGERLDGITIIKSDVPSDRYALLGATSFAFSRKEHRGPWDYIFVDEASQVSLADIVAVGSAARNIVLLGDQMQLPQPIEGTHPGESGFSVLDYLMWDGDAKQTRLTVPDDMGIFLGLTHRMHPDLCRPISRGVYEGRLEASDACDNQTLVLAAGHDPALRPTGVVYLPVPHEGCSQASAAECDRIKTLYNSLLGQSWRDKNGEEHPITAEDILVVAPYNAQVRRLRETLGSGARVGTVDKFQGQEAAVCIISMASSNAEEMPRGVDFLFSRNRLNVAVSRAKCLSVIVASPGLEAMGCDAVEDMALLNFYESLIAAEAQR